MNSGNAALPAVGEPAPDFTLPSTDGTDVTLSSFRGSTKVVLAFFPLAFTGVCMAELCSFTEDHTQFANLNAEVLGISVDSVPTLVAFRAKYDMEITLLSDFKREVSRSYGTLLEDKFFPVEPMSLLTKRESCGGRLPRPSWGTGERTPSCLATSNRYFKYYAIPTMTPNFPS